MTDEAVRHAARRERLVAALRAAPTGGAPLRLAKRTSNLFRDRSRAARQRLDLGEFDHVIDVDVEDGCLDVEGLASYEAIVAATLSSAVMPAVVPQLKTITIGGAVAGVGIEATSFRYGLAHHSVIELQILLPDGEIVTCRPDNEHRDLFFAFPNSYGTLGYALRAKLRLIPAGPFVRVEHITHRRADEYFADLAARCMGAADFVDGVVFGPQRLVVSEGCFVDEAPWLSDFGFERIYYQSLLDIEIDYLSAHDYLWRWDTDWFWCSKHFLAQRPLVRKLFGRERLNSHTWSRLMRLNSRLGLSTRIAGWRGLYRESVIQDVDIPFERAEEFLDFLLREIGILPVWICPICAPVAGANGDFTLYPLRPATLYLNFGFWDVIQQRAAHSPGWFNRLVERKVIELGGIKSLYSDSHFTRDEFAQAYGIEHYERLKSRYDPGGQLPGLYEKCVENN